MKWIKTTTTTAIGCETNWLDSQWFRRKGKKKKKEKQSNCVRGREKSKTQTEQSFTDEPPIEHRNHYYTFQLYILIFVHSLNSFESKSYGATYSFDWFEQWFQPKTICVFSFSILFLWFATPFSISPSLYLSISRFHFRRRFPSNNFVCRLLKSKTDHHCTQLYIGNIVATSKWCEWANLDF